MEGLIGLVRLCSKYEGFYHFLDGTDSDMLLYIDMRFSKCYGQIGGRTNRFS